MNNGKGGRPVAFWFPERVQQLRDLAAAGLTAGQIAPHFGPEMTEKGIQAAGQRFSVKFRRATPGRKAPAKVMNPEQWWRWLLHQMPRPGHGQLAG